ncbi:hypothetical protein MRX96_057797 [Rhipicephalus microplus]
MHHLQMYWCSDSFFRVKEIAQVMTYKRFQLITNCLHLNNNDLMADYGTKDYDRSYKVRPLMDMMNERFLANYTPSSHLAVDESMILFKGRSSMKQYMPMKPKIKRGYKVWSLADSETGYLLKFQLYEGKSAHKPDDVTLGEHVVLTLTDGAVPAGSQVFFDNFFSSTKLLQVLQEKDILACGTFRVNKRDLPQVVKENNKLERGSYIWRRKAEVVAYQWRDSKNVHLMSNYHDPEDRVQVHRTLQNGKKMAVECPSVVKDYNTWMGGVDKFDQKRNAYPADRRSKRWWSRIFYFMLDAAKIKRYNESSPQQKGEKNGRAMSGVPDELRFAGNGHHPKFTGTSKRLIVREGHQTELPCDLRDALSNDSLAFAHWYHSLAFVHWYHSPERDFHSGSSGAASPLGYGFRAAAASREPIYTVDFGPDPTLSGETTAGATGGNGAAGGRGNNLLQVSRSASHGWIRRAYFLIIGHPASLKVNSVRFEDAGLYTCTAVYRDGARRNDGAATRRRRGLVKRGNILAWLKHLELEPLYVASDVRIDWSRLGVFDDDDAAVCEGKPKPTLVWSGMPDGMMAEVRPSLEAQLTTSTLRIHSLRREDLRSTLYCTASNNISSPADTSVTLDLNRE